MAGLGWVDILMRYEIMSNKNGLFLDVVASCCGDTEKSTGPS